MAFVLPERKTYETDMGRANRSLSMIFQILKVIENLKGAHGNEKKDISGKG
ncbi:hypothetical protein [Anaerotruncus colihominis]|uniref:hypothetical protein n=1 Tax=Anaerotruncus colihominis TaxID=169435 RepID=UPI0013646C6F|nr:hypothetical protein [Anaerotruncus colihominis]